MTRLDAAKAAYAEDRITLDELEVLTEYLLASGDGDRWAPDGYGGYPDSLDLRHARDELRRIHLDNEVPRNANDFQVFADG